MSIDINKIIQESVQNTLNEQENNDEVISLTESTNEDVKSQGKTKETNEEVYENDFDPTVASSISAGLGALTFRNHYRALKEQSQGSKLKTTGKIGAGLGAAGLAGAAARMSRGSGLTGPEAGLSDSGLTSGASLKNIATRGKKMYDKLKGDD